MADEEQKSIRDSIEEAMDAVEQGDDDAARPAPRPEREDEGDAEGGRVRDERGRFVRQEGEPEEPEPEAPKPEPRQPRREAEPEQAPVQEPPREETQERRLARISKNWRAEDKEFLAQQPREVQDFLLARDQEMTTAYTRKTQKLAGLESEYGPIAQMFEPDLPAIRAAGYTPQLLIQGWANAERALLSGPDQAAQTLRNIAEGYRIPRETVAYAFGFDPRTPDQIRRAGAPVPPGAQEVIPPNAAHGANGNGMIRDPRVDLLLAERQDMAERMVIARNQQFRNAASQAQAQINEFRDAVDERGNALHPHFDEVENYMTALAEFHGKSTGRIPHLQQLYEDAVNANPATRARLVADAQKAQSDKQRQAEAARGKTEQARRASSSVVGSGRPTNRTQAAAAAPRGQSIRASIDAAMEQLSEQE
ncbi:MAG TPA: hypothetical protein VH184_15885 [Dongiaceae bacterium]|jgi:hypothetical protein|nr:hypothetical protein [Dongiaceae bacterium]